MKIQCVLMCEKSDVEIVFDDDTGSFRVLVAVNRLPYDKKIDISSPERIARHFEHVRENMVKINKGHDGWQGNIYRFEILDEKMKELSSAGYIIPKNYALALTPYQDALKPEPAKKRAKKAADVNSSVNTDKKIKKTEKRLKKPKP